VTRKHTYTHTPTHARTHTRTRTHAHARTHMRARTRAKRARGGSWPTSPEGGGALRCSRGVSAADERSGPRRPLLFIAPRPRRFVCLFVCWRTPLSVAPRMVGAPTLTPAARLCGYGRRRPVRIAAKRTCVLCVRALLCPAVPNTRLCCRARRCALRRGPRLLTTAQRTLGESSTLPLLLCGASSCGARNAKASAPAPAPACPPHPLTARAVPRRAACTRRCGGEELSPAWRRSGRPQSRMRTRTRAAVEPPPSSSCALICASAWAHAGASAHAADHAPPFRTDSACRASPRPHPHTLRARTCTRKHASGRNCARTRVGARWRRRAPRSSSAVCC
jgi:hypothetical protein